MGYNLWHFPQSYSYALLVWLNLEDWRFVTVAYHTVLGEIELLSTVERGDIVFSWQTSVPSPIVHVGKRKQWYSDDVSHRRCLHHPEPSTISPPRHLFVVKVQLSVLFQSSPQTICSYLHFPREMQNKL